MALKTRKFGPNTPMCQRSINFLTLKATYAEIFENFFNIDFTMKETLKYINFYAGNGRNRSFRSMSKLGPKVSVMPEHRQAKVLMGRAHYQKVK